ncbi:MAG: NHL repeat-containing protein [Chitinophagaceae bacterium]
MKKYFSLLVAMILAAGNGCKKDKQAEKPTAQPAAEKKIVVTTIAGDGTKDFLDGPALSAKFKVPFDVVVGADGTIYVTDASNRRIRQIRNGLVTTFAGNGKNGIVNGNGDFAQFRTPYFVALDANENLFTLDVSDSRIRKISPDADVSTYAGTDTPGFTDGTTAIAQFRASEGGIVADTEGNIYVSDYNNQRIRKISITGQVTTIAGNGMIGFKNGSGEAAQFNFPGGIAVDKQGNLYVADGLNPRIRKITPGGQVSTFAGNGISGKVDGDAAVAQFIYITDIVIDSKGNLYVADDDRVRKISPQGVVSTIAGSIAGYADGDGISAQFNDPTGLGVDAQGNIYVADTFNNRIRKISFE